MSVRFCTLFSSSKGNCAYIKNGKDEFLIDCGASPRALEQALRSIGTSLARIRNVFITHEHTDHIKGLETLCRHYRIQVYAPKGCIPKISRSCKIFPEKINILTPLEPVYLPETAVCPVSTPHDADESVGFRIKAGDERIGYFTDIGHLTENVLSALSGCKKVVIESNHDINMLKNGPYPEMLKQRILGANGHLSNDSCAELLPHLVSHGTESFALAHLSQENNRPELAFSASGNKLLEKGIKLSQNGCAGDVLLQVAPVCGIVEL